MVDPNDVTLSAPVFLDLGRSRTTDAAEIARKQQRLRELQKSRLLTSPFRSASFWIERLFATIKKILYFKNTVDASIKGRNGVWGLDRDSAWALEDGKALDRLVKHRLL